MPGWKIFVVLLFAIATLALACATLIVPITLTPDEGRWLWLAGLLFADVVVGTLFVLFLKSADRHFTRPRD